MTGTAYGQLRLYDIRASRHQVWSVETEEQRPVTWLMMAPPSNASQKSLWDTLVYADIGGDVKAHSLASRKQ